MAAIEYFLVNIPETLTKNPKRFISALCETNKDEVFDELVVQTILKFKWSAYTRRFFTTQAFIYLIFLITLSADLSDKKHTDDHFTVFAISLKTIGLLCQLYFFSYEMKSASRQGIRNYASEFWNWGDFFLVVTYIAFCVLDFLGTAFDEI